MAPARILIVDDDPDISEAMRVVLENQGYEVQHAADGAREHRAWQLAANPRSLEIRQERVHRRQTAPRVRHLPSLDVVSGTTRSERVSATAPDGFATRAWIT